MIELTQAIGRKLQFLLCGQIGSGPRSAIMTKIARMNTIIYFICTHFQQGSSAAPGRYLTRIT